MHALSDAIRLRDAILAERAEERAKAAPVIPVERPEARKNTPTRRYFFFPLTLRKPRALGGR